MTMISDADCIRLLRSGEVRVILQDLPGSVRGFCYHDADGNPYIILNSRQTREQNRKTALHEARHIIAGDMYNESYQEYA